MNILKITASIAGVALVLVSGVASASPGSQFGVVGLYKVSNSQVGVIDRQKVAELGCQIRLDGKVANAQGKIDLPQPNKFVFLQCENSLLGMQDKRLALNQLVENGQSLAILEGNLVDFPASKNPGQISDRQYVLKISYYNNRDANKRDSDLEKLTTEAVELPDTYVTESFIGVNEALGMPTPDEVVVLYYDDAKKGERFRKNNGPLLQKIGAFNKTHLLSVVYYVGSAVN